MSKRSHRMDENILENRVIVSLIIIFAIVVISIGYIWISNSVKSKTNLDKQIAKQDNSNEINNNSLEVDKKTNEDSESASSSIGKSVEDSKNTNDETGKTENDNSNSLTNETSNFVNNENSKTNKTNDTNNANSNENFSTANNSDNNIVNNKPEENNVSNAENNVQPSFIMPAEGEILKGFSKENLVFSETLQEWLTHQALDIKANSRDVVKCSADGKVKAIKNDPRYGLTVIVEHSAGFETVYSNLLTAEFVVEGEEVKQGQTLGTVGTSAVFEIADESHLHFEMLLNSEYVDPNLYINK